MKSWQLLVLGLASLALTACRADPNIPILERELRLQEDKMYQLNGCLEDQQSALESCRRENAALRKRLQAAGDTSDAAADFRSSEPAPSRSPKSPGALNGPAFIKPPSIELPAESLPEGQVPETFRVPAKPAPPSKQPPSEPPKGTQRSAGVSGQAVSGPMLPDLAAADVEGSANGNGASAVQGDSRQVAKIVLNRLVTGGYNTSGRPGHDGVLLVIEPRDAQGRLVEAPADVTVVVLDPALQGQAARVARWDFTADEIASRFNKTLVAGGIQLEMPWPADPPAHDDLHLFVRYTTSDGRKLEADRRIKVNASEPLARDWVPTDRSAAEPATPVAQSSRPADAWRAAPAASPSPGSGDFGRASSAARSADASPRVAALPATRPLPRSSPASEAKVQRPVWSPERQ